jgi:lipoprotein-anchoring transpeptidase ErfK/SrfK
VKLSRRKFLQLAAFGAGYGLIPKNIPGAWKQSDVDLIDQWKKTYSNGTRLGRLTATLSLRTRPDAEAPAVGKKYTDNIVTILREVVGKGPAADPHNHRWFETPDGFLWAPYVFPQDFQIQTPLDTIPNGKVWVEVTVPWVQGRVSPDISSPLFSIQPDRPATMYYASIYPATKAVKDEQGRTWYFLDELAAPIYARAEGLRVITAEEIAPISPDVDDKLIVVDLRKNLATLSALENGKEVFYAVISPGGRKPDTGEWSTPAGEHPIYRKRIGVRMSGGTQDTGYDLIGVGWTCLFTGHGEAIHSTYWHNDFGIPKSHGCVNARPEDAKWIFRWTTPAAPYPGGDVEKGMPGGTRVKVVV